MRLFAYILLFAFGTSFAQNGDTESLIVVQYDQEEGPDLKQSIYRYDFNKDIFSGKEKLLTVEGKKGGIDYIRFDLGENTLYKNRYLISGYGNIIDLTDRKVIYDGNGKVVYCANDSVVYFVNDPFDGKYYTLFNLKTNTYSEIKSKTYKALPGQEVEFDRTKSPYKLIYFPEKKPKEILMEDAGHGGVNTGSSYKIGGAPIYWVDNEVFLFPNVKVTNLEGSIVKYDLKTRTAKEIGNFSSTSNLSPGYKLVKGKSSFVEFYFKDRLYLINPIKDVMLLTGFKEFDAGFSVEMIAKQNGRGVWLKGKEVGRNHFELKSFKSSDNYAALLKEVFFGDESLQQGLVVYHVGTNKWEDISAEKVVAVIGWIK